MNRKLELKLIERVKKDPNNLKNIREQTEAICLEAVKISRHALQYVNNQTEEICLAAIEHDVASIEYIKDKTPAICLAAVKQDGNALYYIKNKTEEMCLIGVKHDGKYLCYVENQTDNICIEALKNNFNGAIRLIDIKEKSTAIIVLKASLQHMKNKIILTEILEKFNEDKEILDFYTKHNIWKYVDLSKVKFNDNLIQYGMTI